VDDLCGALSFVSDTPLIRVPFSLSRWERGRNTD
jgi:hypothetical protein